MLSGTTSTTARKSGVGGQRRKQGTSQPHRRRCGERPVRAGVAFLALQARAITIVGPSTTAAPAHSTHAVAAAVIGVAVEADQRGTNFRRIIPIM